MKTVKWWKFMVRNEREKKFKYHTSANETSSSSFVVIANGVPSGSGITLNVNSISIFSLFTCVRFYCIPSVVLCDAVRHGVVMSI